ncbi:calmodulin-binding protein 60 B-like [Rhododendron vialii]|uniref:calmodulin-binding protein 60 B-like n=1 Tax=Rhododendron vialii TaxID=182163 RepID=UPI00265F1404|nr:calmodulin-binding protein 60 B-like [Rhododendron vialii]
MVLKRASSDWEYGDGSEAPRHESKRRLAFATDVRDVLKGFSLDEFMTKLEPFFRNLVREEVERKILLFSHASPRSLLNQVEPSHARNWQLHFDDRWPSTLFTGSKIESEHGKPVKIVLLDAISKNIITSLTLSSIKVQIVVLNGDFGVDDEEDWTEEEFNTNVVQQREGKRPLVTGELVVTLRGGVGYIGDVSFTDNSSWIRSGRFKLGARTVSSELRIREAKSEAFAVKDRRGELYKKHHPPNFSDDIWRLEKIAKDGQFHKRLASMGITTVKEFLCFYYRDPSSLRKILGGGILNKTWEKIIEHATACVLDNKLFMYPRDEERVGIVLNSVFKVVAAVFDGQVYEPLDKLDVLQMGLVENLKRHAYKNLDYLVPLDESPVFGPGMVPASLQPIILPGVHQDQQKMQLVSNHGETSLPYFYDPQDQFQLEVSVEQHSQPMQLFTPTPSHGLMSTDSYSGPYCGGNSWAPGESLGPLMQIGHQTANNSFQIGTPTWGADGLFLSPSNQAVGFLSSDFGFDITRNGKPKLRWRLVRAVMKWGISVRRVVAAKKWQGLFA